MTRNLLALLVVLLISTASQAAPKLNDWSDNTGAVTKEVSAPYGSFNKRVQCLFDSTDTHGANPCGPILVQNCIHINVAFDPDTLQGLDVSNNSLGDARVYMRGCPTNVYDASTCQRILASKGASSLSNTPYDGAYNGGVFMYDIIPVFPFLFLERSTTPATGEKPSFAISCSNS